MYIHSSLKIHWSTTKNNRRHLNCICYSMWHDEEAHCVPNFLVKSNFSNDELWVRIVFFSVFDSSWGTRKKNEIPREKREKFEDSFKPLFFPIYCHFIWQFLVFWKFKKSFLIKVLDTKGKFGLYYRRAERSWNLSVISKPGSVYFLVYTFLGLVDIPRWLFHSF